ncbi:MAG: LOG family protein [Actinomycetota bacterium]
MDAVLGPDRRGVVLPSEAVPEAVRALLTEAGIPTATPRELGLAARDASESTPRDVAALAAFFAEATRRPALVEEDGGWLAASGDRQRHRGTDPVRLAEHLLDRPVPARIAVFGGAWITEEEPEYGHIRRLGEWLAERNVHVVCGGYQGAMAAVCRGAAGHRGTTVGVTISAWDDQVTVNRWLTHEVVARDLFARLPLITDAEAWVAFSGGVGTLQEVALCWNLVQNRLAEPRPLVLVGEAWDRQLRLFRELLRVSDPAHFDLVQPVRSVDDVLPVLRPLVDPA